MRPSKKALSKLDPEYLAQIKTEKKIASESKQCLMFFTKENITEACLEIPGNRERNDPNYLVLLILNDFFRNSVLYHDRVGINKVKELMDLKNELSFRNFKKWFISLRDLQNEFKHIQKQGIKIIWKNAHFAIRCYLKAKFSNELLVQYLSVTFGGDRMNKLEQEVLKLKMKIKYAKGQELVYFKTDFDLEFYEKYKVFKEASSHEKSDSLEGIRLLKRMLGGKVEDFWLKSLVDECFIYDKKKMSKTEFLSNIYNLFRILVQDRELIDEEVFYQKKYRSYKSFESYKCKIVKQIIYPKRKGHISSV